VRLKNQRWKPNCVEQKFIITFEISMSTYILMRTLDEISNFQNSFLQNNFLQFAAINYFPVAAPPVLDVLFRLKITF